MVWDGLPCCVTLQLISLWHVIFHQSYATWASWCLKSPATRLIFHQCVKAINYLNVKTLRNWHTASQENHKTLSCGFSSQRTGDTEIASRSWRHLIIEKRTMDFGQLQSLFFSKEERRWINVNNSMARYLFLFIRKLCKVVTEQRPEINFIKSQRSLKDHEVLSSS